ncbi:MAG: ribonuclease J [Parcubacteria group bacterium Gr01-1014_46]|nr:MAG: ribonuclease J [Parcubacteria group bacterium Gr01-1014_46]
MEREETKTTGEVNATRDTRSHSGTRSRQSFRGKSFGRRDTPTVRNTMRKTEDIIPPIEGDNIRIIPLGGVEEIGRNMTMIEYKGDIIVVDIGFQFKDEDTPGIDYILPNTKYLEDNKERIKGVFITHGHLDHIGGLPFIIDRIGYPKIFTRQFGAIMIQKRQDEFPHLKPLDIQIIDGNETITCGALKIKTFPISHTIPDSMGLVIETLQGNIVFIEDVRVDNIKGVPTEEEIEQYKRFKDMNVLLLTMDSTSIEKPGFSLSENVVVENIDQFIKDTKSRLIIATFASQVERIISIIKSAEKYGKKLVIEGRSMKSNIEIIKQLKLVEVNNIIPLEDIENYPPDRIVMLVTGAQGEEFAALMRIANKTHKYVRLKPTDTVLLSASVIPTNHKSVVNLKDNLYRSGAKIVTYLDSDIHASGHGNRDELKWIHQQIPYKFFMPVHGQHYMLCQHAELSYSLGHNKESVVIPDNGSIVEIYDNGDKIRILKEKVPSSLVLVDGFAVGNIQEMVIRDRKMLAQDGIFLIVVSLNTKTGKLKKSPDIISRGFVYLRESQDLLNHTRMIIKKTTEDTTRGMNPIDFDLIKGALVDDVGRYLFQQTAKKPIVIPVILGV